MEKLLGELQLERATTRHILNLTTLVGRVAGSSGAIEVYPTIKTSKVAAVKYLSTFLNWHLGSQTCMWVNKLEGKEQRKNGCTVRSGMNIEQAVWLIAQPRYNRQNCLIIPLL